MKKTIELSDPRSLRALAHPTRLTLVGLLRLHGALTATQAGRLLGLNSGNCSFHLRLLARYGLVEEVPTRGRNKPWRVTALTTSWPSAASAPEMAEAVRLLSGSIAEYYFASMRRWLDRRTEEPVTWQEATWFDDSLLYVTATELGALGRQIADLLAPFEERAAYPERRPADSRMVTAIRVAIPHQDVVPEVAPGPKPERTEPS